MSIEKGSATIPWKTLRFLCYLALSVVIPGFGLILGGASIAKGFGKKKAQGLVLFVVANVSILAYGILFTTIIGWPR